MHINTYILHIMYYIYFLFICVFSYGVLPCIYVWVYASLKDYVKNLLMWCSFVKYVEPITIITCTCQRFKPSLINNTESPEGKIQPSFHL